MKVLVLSNGKFIKKDIETGLDALQKEVEGYIEIPFISEKLHNKKIDMIINEEGKLIDGMKIEIIVVYKEKVVDVVYGNVVFASTDEEGNTIGLTDDQMDFVMQELSSQMLIVDGVYTRTVRLLYI